MTSDIVVKDCIGRELRIGDTIVYFNARNSAVYPSKRIIYQIDMTTNHGEIVPFIRANEEGRWMNKRDGRITNMDKVILIKHKPIKGNMPVHESDIVYME